MSRGRTALLAVAAASLTAGLLLGARLSGRIETPTRAAETAATCPSGSPRRSGR